MGEGDEPRELSLLGGPLHRLGGRLGLVRGGTNTVALGLVLGGLSWAVLLALTLVEGMGHEVFSLAVLAGHVRLLVAIPLFFLCESMVAARLAELVRTLVRSQVVTADALPALESEVARTARWKDSWLAEAAFLLVTVLLSWAVPSLGLAGTTATLGAGRAAGEMSLTGLWYWFVCVTLFRFLTFRWLWRLWLWARFLWRLSRLELRLVPTHPDGVAGVGYLEVVHGAFVPLVVAISAVQSAALAEAMSAGTMSFGAISPTLALVLVVDAALFLAPLLVFAPKLYRCRARGLARYMELGAQYVRQFDEKWLGAGAGPGEPLLGTPDMQSLADLSNSVRVVSAMRLVPVSRRLLLSLAAAALLPMLPLVLFGQPIEAVAGAVFKVLFGL